MSDDIERPKQGKGVLLAGSGEGPWLMLCIAVAVAAIGWMLFNNPPWLEEELAGLEAKKEAMMVSGWRHSELMKTVERIAVIKHKLKRKEDK